MTTQPESLRLADLLEQIDGQYWQVQDSAAAELRRLHAENEALRKTLAASCDEERQQMWEAGPGGGCLRALSAEFQRDALLEALKAAEPYLRHANVAYNVSFQIRAAIAKAEENA